MKIDNKKINTYSEKSRNRIISFAQVFLSIIEIYQTDNEKNIPLSDFERESFSYNESVSIIKTLNEILGEITVIFRPNDTWHGPNRIRERYVEIKTKPDAISKIKSFLKKTKQDTNSKITSKSLKGCNIIFDDPLAQIIIDGDIIQLPSYGKEHLLSRSMFNRRKGEIVDWSIIYNEMQGSTNLPDNDGRYVYDACRDVNKRIQELFKTKEKLYIFSKKTVKRLY